MAEYEFEEFIAIYGKFDKYDEWHFSHVTHVCVDENVATLYRQNRYYGTLNMVFHEGKWKKHGIYTLSCLRTDYYFEYDVLHREDGPAYISRHENGQIWLEVWYNNDRRHRLNAPAVQRWDNQGNLIEEYYYVDGVRIGN
tara:strand:- start:850 stop:1269 length:420 start_codon:yes stop_codon:yes gene_type:complete